MGPLECSILSTNQLPLTPGVYSRLNLMENKQKMILYEF